MSEVFERYPGRWYCRSSSSQVCTVLVEAGLVDVPGLGMTKPDSLRGSKDHEMIRDQVAKGQDKKAGLDDLRGMGALLLRRLGGMPEKDKPPADDEMLQRDFIRGT
ncbi:hypothetical protein E4U17_004348, partial [Claviceps sp. LM77 group G4]